MRSLSDGDRVRANILRALYKESKGYASNTGGALACSTCGCLDIEVTGWIGANTGTPTGDEGPSAQVWCPDCETHDDDGFCCLAIRRGRVVCESGHEPDCAAASNVHRGTKWDEKAAQS